MKLNHQHDLTDEPNDAPASELRPVFQFDGATHGAMMEQEAMELGLSKEFRSRFLRRRALPVPHTSPVCTHDGITTACSDRSRVCFAAFECTECGLPLADKSDACGWILDGVTADRTRVPLGASLMCTACVHAVFRFCPHMWVAERQTPQRYVLRQVFSTADYIVEERKATIQAVPEARAYTHAEFTVHRAEERSRNGGRRKGQRRQLAE